ncbi:DUF2334 domain-containing protein [archaeon]|nr:DUF2334 domain-containing protein [archaeon]
MTLFAMLLLVFFKPQSPAHIIWVEIHDFSPGYGTDEMEALLLVLERHQIDRTIVFVIPNRDENEPIHENTDFVEYLQGLQERGVEVGAHGYSHSGFEFYKSSNEVETLVGKSLDAFSKADIYPRSFYPPRYLIKKEGLEVLSEHYDEVFLLNKLIIDKRTYLYPAYEFIPGMTPRVLKPIANYAYKKIYIRSTSPVFRVNIHLGDIDAETLKELDEFLTLADRYHMDTEDIQSLQNP